MPAVRAEPGLPAPAAWDSGVIEGSGTGFIGCVHPRDAQDPREFCLVVHRVEGDDPHVEATIAVFAERAEWNANRPTALVRTSAPTIYSERLPATALSVAGSVRFAGQLTGLGNVKLEVNALWPPLWMSYGCPGYAIAYEVSTEGEMYNVESVTGEIAGTPVWEDDNLCSDMWAESASGVWAFPGASA